MTNIVLSIVNSVHFILFKAKVGAYGAVFKAINIDTNEVFAIKEIKRTIG